MAIWSRVLGVAVGVDDDFFELGGDSMAGLMVVNYAEELGIDLTPADLAILRRIIDRDLPWGRRLRRHRSPSALVGT